MWAGDANSAESPSQQTRIDDLANRNWRRLSNNSGATEADLFSSSRSPTPPKAALAAHRVDHLPLLSRQRRLGPPHSATVRIAAVNCAPESRIGNRIDWQSFKGNIDLGSGNAVSSMPLSGRVP
jgi:hypothetical protein